ncbi:P-loop containing nucleoside triphosphate hydrolase protein [Annulohypoxylon bovei var. microspora]|nr:P-loop containing nucleoside triphosphate hydrolase protein [Annulohypoxylon bovei var. microspora]
MGQPISKPGTASAAPNVLNDRTPAPVQRAVPKLSVQATIDDSQAYSASQNQTLEDRRASLPSLKQRRDSNKAPSSNGYCTSATVDLGVSPSSYKHDWHSVPVASHYPQLMNPPEDEFEECHINGGHAFRRHLTKPGLEIICPHLNKFLWAVTDPSTKRRGDGLLPRFSVYEPYRPIFHNREKISQSKAEDTDDHIKEHVQALLRLIKKKKPLTWEKLDEIEAKKCYNIAFKDLWLLFPPGKTVFSRDDGAWRAYKVGRVDIYPESDSENISIHCWFLDFDNNGQWLVPHEKVFHVPSYSSEQPIINLNVIPDWYFGNLEDMLIERGKNYLSYGSNVFYRAYAGDAWPRTSQQDPDNVIIDYVTSCKYRQDTGLNEPYCTGVVCCICQGNAVQLGSYPANAPHDSDICKTQQIGSHTNNEKYLMFCPPRLWAFSLRHKSWKMIPPQELEEVKHRDESFKRLQMDEYKKKDLEHLLRGYLENRQTSANLDLIKGKGQGLNVLLHGNPGTGKTLTVESLCEKLCIPLYMLTCGELGNGTDDFKNRLERAFLRAVNWGAILLLEEADIFVRQREHDIQRCAIVSSFLNRLDYSRAMVFMATNRVKIFDPALKSRVHIMLTFPDFDFKTQQEIWNDAIHRLPDVSPNDKENLQYWVRSELESLDEKRHVRMNGRQIRNCINAASALAHGNPDDRSLKSLHVKKILRLGEEFMEYVRQGDTPDIEAIMEDRSRQDQLARQITP